MERCAVRRRCHTACELLWLPVVTTGPVSQTKDACPVCSASCELHVLQRLCLTDTQLCCQAVAGACKGQEGLGPLATWVTCAVLTMLGAAHVYPAGTCPVVMGRIVPELGCTLFELLNMLLIRVNCGSVAIPCWPLHPWAHLSPYRAAPPTSHLQSRSTHPARALSCQHQHCCCCCCGSGGVVVDMGSRRQQQCSQLVSQCKACMV
jgi:hypothetical protein